ncbi:MAG: hypothetical protein ABH824_06105 [Nanoarchaeota archaeon]|nr:hypothetical protein [Nanoarchaeota archaeon]MBU1631994.1 hypothetical protein [Nanoarchaeota archaeon]MBU1876616.1 hypothetical protein [Nanoarchaeota archaeon]
MSTLLSGPISLKQVLELIESSTRTFYKNWVGNPVKVDFTWWDPDYIIIPDVYNLLPSSSSSDGIYGLVKRCEREGLIRQLRPIASDFAVTVKAYHDSKLELRTRIYDKTLLSDLVSGQTFPPARRDFVISSDNVYSGFFERYKREVGGGRVIKMANFHEEWIEYKNQQVAEAQRRIDASISKSAYHILNDLHK